MGKAKIYKFILALMGITIVLFACNEEKEGLDSVETDDIEASALADETDLIPSFMNWQAEQLFLVEEKPAEPMNHRERKKLDPSYLATESPSQMEEDGKNPIFYSFEGNLLKTGHLIMSEDISGSPEEGKVAFGSDDMEYKVEEHSITNISYEEDSYIVETDNQEYELTVQSATELVDQYGNPFTVFDTTFSELFEQFKESLSDI